MNLTTLLCAVTLILMTIQLSGQNLVPNPSFEEIDSCKLALSSTAREWGMATIEGTPDLFNECSVDPVFGVPVPFLGCDTLSAFTGQGYAGITVYGYREYPQAMLDRPLATGEHVYIAFHVSPSTFCIPSINRFTDAVGLAFSETELNVDIPPFGDTPLELPAAVENRGTVIKNSGTWTKVSGCYEASGGESYVIIGNFLHDDSTIIEAPAPWTVTQNYFFIDEVIVEPFDPLPDTTALCGDSVTINSRFEALELTWSTGMTGYSASTDRPGYVYGWVDVDDCRLKDSTFVIDLSTLEDITLHDSICPGETLTLTAPYTGEYLWSTGSIQPSIDIQSKGIFTVTVTNACKSLVTQFSITSDHCACSVFVPNIFTPNGDGINDELRPILTCPVDIDFESFGIYDRWGSLLFTTTDPLVSWDGGINKKGVIPGVYVWQLIYSVRGDNGFVRQVEYGDVTIVD